MEFSEITARLPLPSFPKENSELEWGGIERDIGVELPLGYKEFVSTYGTGSIGNFLWIFNPISKNRSLNIEAIRYLQSAYEELKRDFPDDYIRPTFPNTNSFLPWAITDNGDTLVWVLDGEPADDWTVAIMGPDQVEEEVTEFSFVEFIAQLLDKNLASRILPQQFLDMDKSFLPLT
jgi:hypothetical protein